MAAAGPPPRAGGGRLLCFACRGTVLAMEQQPRRFAEREDLFRSMSTEEFERLAPWTDEQRAALEEALAAGRHLVDQHVGYAIHMPGEPPRYL